MLLRYLSKAKRERKNVTAKNGNKWDGKINIGSCQFLNWIDTKIINAVRNKNGLFFIVL